jgi:hypothetical protein
MCCQQGLCFLQMIAICVKFAIYIVPLLLYREVFKAIDVFMALRFTASMALLAAKRMQILSMTQHTWRR